MQLMINEHLKYITLNDSRVIANGELDIGGKLITLCEFDFSEFSTVQRKVIFGWARGQDKVKYSEAFKSTLLSNKKVTFTLDADSQGASINLEGKRINLDLEAMPAGNYTLELKVFLDRPLEALGEVPDHIKPLLQYSEILNVTAIIDKKFDSTLSPTLHAGPVYDGASRLGFFLADLDKMDAIVTEASSTAIIDLQKEFCETEIANDLFEAGVLILVWGMTPWHYYIYGLSAASDVNLIPCAKKPQFRGQYKIRNDIRKLSVVPGEQLLNWPLCREKNWPKIDLLGDGESVELNLHLRAFDPIDGEFGPTLAVVTVHRVDEAPLIDPLLVVDIESVDIDPGY
ncbi:hypothetical protein N028_24550 [Pseudomonas syringae USA011]|nr:hypothetical protein N028_24550 [Pseudomonas syringae USA011]